jgi:hypothetical protein
MKGNPTCRSCHVSAVCLGGGIYAVNLGPHSDSAAEHRVRVPVAYVPRVRETQTLAWLLHGMLTREVDWQCPRFQEGEREKL